MKLVWDKIGERFYETGVEKGVLYPMSEGAYPAGYAWNGLSSISESPTGAEPTPIYANNKKYLTMISTEEFGGTIEAYTYPDQWATCDGSMAIAGGVMAGQQTRNTFGLSYVTQIANDEEGVDHGYIIHLVYGALASPSDKTYSTINDSPEANTLSWEFTTTPVDVVTEVAGKKVKAVSLLTIDSRKADPTKLAALEAILYGTDAAEGGTPEAVVARLPMPDEVITLMGAVTAG